MLQETTSWLSLRTKGKLIMADHYIHSTCGQNMVFRIVESPKRDSPDVNVKEKGRISIAGGAWVINKDSRIPRVAITKVTDDELKILEDDPAFQRMKDRGFFTVHTVDHMEADSRDLPKDHAKKDNTAQIEDEDHANGTDERCDHSSTRATFGDGNQYGGKQPVVTENDDYGPIRLS